MTEGDKDLSFEKLACYQLAMKLVQAGYRLAESLPQTERYNLADQLRRAVVSIALNIAEGYGRYHYLDRLRFLYIARGSLNETLSCFQIAHELGYVDDDQIKWIRQTYTEALKTLNGYVAFIHQQKQGSQEFGNRWISEESVEYKVHLTFDEPTDPSES